MLLFMLKYNKIDPGGMPPMGGLSLQDALAKKLQERNKAANPGAQQQTPSPQPTQPTPPKPQPIQQQQQSKWLILYICLCCFIIILVSIYNIT